MDKYKAYLDVRDLKTRESVYRVGLTNLSDNHVERVMMGMLMKMDTDNYYIDDSDVDRARKEV